MLYVRGIDPDDRQIGVRVLADEIGKWLKGIYPCSTGLIVQGLARPEWVMEIDVEAEHARLSKEIARLGTEHARLRDRWAACAAAQAELANLEQQSSELTQRWQAEKDWAQRVSLAHAHIGWVRGTGLMGHNDPLVDAVTAAIAATSTSHDVSHSRSRWNTSRSVICERTSSQMRSFRS